jgi:nitroalkane oxidase
MQMRKIWGVMLDPDFDPRAITESRAIPFKKSMEGVGTLVTPADPPAAETTAAKRGRRR